MRGSPSKWFVAIYSGLFVFLVIVDNGGFVGTYLHADRASVCQGAFHTNGDGHLVLTETKGAFAKKRGRCHLAGIRYTLSVEGFDAFFAPVALVEVESYLVEAGRIKGVVASGIGGAKVNGFAEVGGIEEGGHADDSGLDVGVFAATVIAAGIEDIASVVNLT